MTQQQAGGVSLEYEYYGESGPVLVLVRGLGSQLIDWPSELVDGLVEEGFRVLVFDNRDSGLSQKFATGEQYTLDDMAADIPALMDALKIDCAHVLGISLGGMIVQQLALNHGDRLLSMISVMSSSGRKGLPGPTPEASAALAAETAAGTSRPDVIQALVDGWAVYGSPAYPIPEDERRAVVERRFERDYDPDGVRRQMMAVRATGPRAERLADIRVPTLVIHGEADALVPLEAGVDTADSIPGARLEVIPGMGHDLPAAVMPHMVRLVADFCRKVTS